MQRIQLRKFQCSEIEDVFVAGRRFIPYKNEMLDFSQLEGLPLIFLEKNTSSRTYMEQFLADNHVSLNPEFELAIPVR